MPRKHRIRTMPVRYTIRLVPAYMQGDQSNFHIASFEPDVDGQWIFDPGHVFDVPGTINRAIAEDRQKWLCHNCGEIVEGDFCQHFCS